ncbi:MAG: hypothetical protein GEV08_23905 [Acidimicrobiia bacterium]|nr:hypothetical protein [Acidimicrobiia bacterium]
MTAARAARLGAAARASAWAMGSAAAAATGLVGYQALRLDVRRQWARAIELPPLAAYVEAPSVVEGDPVPVRVHSTAPYRARLDRLGHGVQDTGWRAEGGACPQAPRYDHWRGCQWPVDLVVDAPGLRSGLHVLTLDQTGDPRQRFRLPLVVTPREPRRVAVVASTNTWQAYNPFGGFSNYLDTASPHPWRYVKAALQVLNAHVVVGDRHTVPAAPLPLCRPNLALDADLADLEASPVADGSHLVKALWPLLAKLERDSVDAGLFSDHDFAFDHRPTSAELVVFAPHSEYWAEEMVGRLQAYLHTEGKVAFLSGNNMYRRVRFDERALGVVDQRVDGAAVAALLGVAYDAAGYQSYGGYRVAASDHPFLRGLGVKDGDVIGWVPPSEAPTSPLAGFGASGWETDKLHSASGELTVLAVGTNASGPAFMVAKPTPGGGWLFNAGSVAFLPWIAVDPVLEGLVSRLVELALEDRSAGSEE